MQAQTCIGIGMYTSMRHETWAQAQGWAQALEQVEAWVYAEAMDGDGVGTDRDRHRHK